MSLIGFWNWRSSLLLHFSHGWVLVRVQSGLVSCVSVVSQVHWHNALSFFWFPLRFVVMLFLSFQKIQDRKDWLKNGLVITASHDHSIVSSSGNPHTLLQQYHFWQYFTLLLHFAHSQVLACFQIVLHCCLCLLLQVQLPVHQWCIFIILVSVLILCHMQLADPRILQKDDVQIYNDFIKPDRAFLV